MGYFHAHVCSYRIHMSFLFNGDLKKTFFFFSFYCFCLLLQLVLFFITQGLWNSAVTVTIGVSIQSTKQFGCPRLDGAVGRVIISNQQHALAECSNSDV